MNDKIIRFVMFRKRSEIVAHMYIIYYNFHYCLKIKKKRILKNLTRDNICIFIDIHYYDSKI